MPISDELEAFIDETIRRAIKRGYHPAAFQRLRAEHNTVRAIEKLVKSGEVQSGFTTLAQLGLLEWTIEAAVLRFPDEFSAVARKCAELRLRPANSSQ